jgi:hypothetical protein
VKTINLGSDTDSKDRRDVWKLVYAEEFTRVRTSLAERANALGHPQDVAAFNARARIEATYAADAAIEEDL